MTEESELSPTEIERRFAEFELRTHVITAHPFEKKSNTWKSAAAILLSDGSTRSVSAWHGTPSYAN